MKTEQEAENRTRKTENGIHNTEEKENGKQNTENRKRKNRKKENRKRAPLADLSRTFLLNVFLLVR